MKHYLMPAEEVMGLQGVTVDGLSSADAGARLAREGLNKLQEATKKSLPAKFLEQLADPMIVVLIGAAIVSGALGEIADMVIILTVVLLNGVLGVYQEGKAERAIEALQEMASPFSRVRRDGEVILVKSEEIVPGDIVLIEAGDSVPADMRLIETASLKIEESSLTGESIPVEKFSNTIETNDRDVPLGDRFNMAYMGTSVAYGRGEGVVVATGMATEMGRIADIIAKTADDRTPSGQTCRIAGSSV